MFSKLLTATLILAYFTVNSTPAPNKPGQGPESKDWNKLNIVQAGSVPAITYFGKASNPSKLSVFFRGTDNILQNVLIELSPDGKEKWSAPKPIPGKQIWSNPIAFRWKHHSVAGGLHYDNRIYLHDGTDAGHHHNWYGLGMGHVMGHPSACSVGDMAFVFTRGFDNSFYFHQRHGNSHWSGHNGMGGMLISNPGSAGFQPSKGNHRAVVIGIGGDNAMWQRFFQGQAWLDWKNQGGLLIGNPVAVPAVPKAECDEEFSGVEIYATHASGILHRMFFDGDTWMEWDQMPFNVPKEFTAINLKNGTNFFVADRSWSLTSRTFVMPK